MDVFKALVEIEELSRSKLFSREQTKREGINVRFNLFTVVFQQCQIICSEDYERNCIIMQQYRDFGKIEKQHDEFEMIPVQSELDSFQSLEFFERTQLHNFEDFEFSEIYERSQLYDTQDTDFLEILVLSLENQFRIITSPSPSSSPTLIPNPSPSPYDQVLIALLLEAEIARESDEWEDYEQNELEQWFLLNQNPEERMRQEQELKTCDLCEYDPDTMCAICRENLQDTTLVPCGHTDVCHECLCSIVRSGTNKCPICREHIRDVMSFPFPSVFPLFD